MVKREFQEVLLMVTKAKNEKANAFGGKLRIIKDVRVLQKTKSWINVETYGNANGFSLFLS
jgi:hypothetical protein